MDGRMIGLNISFYLEKGKKGPCVNLREGVLVEDIIYGLMDGYLFFTFFLFPLK
jgi:hypothetical protein